MRDDIHNKAPIAAGLRGVLRQALRPADRQRPERLKDSAIKALAKEIRGSLSTTLFEALALEEASPGLWGREAMSFPHCSTLQSDILDYFTQNSKATAREACESATLRHIDSLCRESEAAMIAAGGNRADVQNGVRAFRTALQDALPIAARACVERSRPEVPDHKVNLSESLPLGKRANESRR